MRLIYLIRHAQAEDREAWSGPDTERPLTKKGRRQAEAISRWLEPQLRDGEWREAASGKRPPVAIRTSPAIRCVQTIEPLAAALNIEPIVDTALMEGLPIELPPSDGIHIICAHGDNIPWLLDRLNIEWNERRKGSTWIVELAGDGKVRTARYQPPPQVES